MKRQCTSDLVVPKSFTFDDLKKFFGQEDIPFLADQLDVLKKQVERHYSIKANAIIQEFPSDLMLQAFSRIGTSTLTLCLPLRTVSKSWLAMLSKFDWSNWITRAYNDFRPERILSLLPFSRIQTPLPVDIDMALLKNVCAIECDLPRVKHDLLSQLAHLTHLRVCSVDLSAPILCLSNLQSLELGMGGGQGRITNLNPLTNLTSLALVGGLPSFCSDDLGGLTKLQDIFSAWRSFFRSGKGRTNQYSGEWLNGKPHGKGCGKFKKDRYEGDWVDGRPHGEGVRQYWNETLGQFTSSRTGSWKNGVACGPGMRVYPNGESYDGWWIDDERSSHGVYKFVDGSVFDGRWDLHDLYKGTCLFPNGDRYKGTLQQGLKHGKGVYTFLGGTEIRGAWDKGRYLDDELSEETEKALYSAALRPYMKWL